MSAAFEIARPLPGASFGATVRLTHPLAQAMPDGLPAALAEAGGLLLIPGLQEIAGSPQLLVDLSREFGPEVEDYRYTLTSASSVHPTVPEIFLVSNMAPVNRAAAQAARAAAHGRRPAAGAVSASQGLAHRPELSPAAARHLAVLCRDAGRARARPDAVRRRHRSPMRRCRRHSRPRSTGCRACIASRAAAARATPRWRAASADAQPPHRALAAAAGRAHPSGDRQARALSLRMGPDGLVRGPVRRPGARAARRGRRAARRADGALHAAGVRLCPRMDGRRPAGVGQSLPRPRRDLVRRREGAAHDVAHHGARQSRRDLCRRGEELGPEGVSAGRRSGTSPAPECAACPGSRRRGLPPRSCPDA